MSIDKRELKRAILITAVLMVLASVVMLYCNDWYNLQGAFERSKKIFWSMPVFAVLICICHYSDGKGLTNKEYINKILPISVDAENRKMYLDYARVMAVMLVIMTHACSAQQNDTAATPWKLTLLTVCAGISLVCNPLYVMISGALLLSSKKEEKIGRFYYKRFIKIVIPLIIYYLIYLCLAEEVSLLPPKNIGAALKQILAGASDVVPHFWMIYVLISLYISAPFVKVMVQNLSNHQINALFVVILVEEAVMVLLPLLGYPIGVGLNLALWEGVFILGYIITQKRQKWMENLLLVLGGISAVIIPIVLLQDFTYTDYVCNCSPLMVTFASAVLIVLSKLEPHMKGKLTGIVQLFSKYSYSLILIHWYGLFGITFTKLYCQPLRFGCIGGIVLTILITMIVCFILGFLADNTIVLVVQKGFQGLVNLLRKQNRERK
ncbi:MAG: acyltransferase [Lachnospiraceae bacterium]|nr:acyltransferase [Lachnospiraceae bacterium]